MGRNCPTNRSHLWLYYVNFPLLFHPVNILKKFGYKLPGGLLIDENAGGYIRKSLVEQDFKLFQSYSESQQITRDTLEWYSQFPDLSEVQIAATWDKDDGEYPGLLAGFAKLMAKFRALRIGMATDQRSFKTEPMSDAGMEAIRTFNGWQMIRKQNKR